MSLISLLLLYYILPPLGCNVAQDAPFKGRAFLPASEAFNCALDLPFIVLWLLRGFPESAPAPFTSPQFTVYFLTQKRARFLLASLRFSFFWDGTAFRDITPLSVHTFLAFTTQSKSFGPFFLL